MLITTKGDNFQSLNSQKINKNDSLIYENNTEQFQQTTQESISKHHYYFMHL
jgi:hypothetical protein